MRIADFELIQEIKDSYLQLRRNGESRTNAEKELIQFYHMELTVGKEDDGILFWIGLADAQFSLGELSEYVALQGLAALKELKLQDWEIATDDISKCELNFSKAPMPERKKITTRRKFRCSWKNGDTFARQLCGEEAELHGIAGRYMLFRKVDELETQEGCLLPIVTLTLWDNTPLPTNGEEYSRLPLLRLSSLRLGIPKGYYEYRTEILFTNKKQLEMLQYLGNFADTPLPKNEVIIRTPGCVLMMHPKQLDHKCCVYWKLHQAYSSER